MIQKKFFDAVSKARYELDIKKISHPREFGYWRTFSLRNPAFGAHYAPSWVQVVERCPPGGCYEVGAVFLDGVQIVNAPAPWNVSYSLREAWRTILYRAWMLTGRMEIMFRGTTGEDPLWEGCEPTIPENLIRALRQPPIQLDISLEGNHITEEQGQQIFVTLFREDLDLAADTTLTPEQRISLALRHAKNSWPRWGVGHILRNADHPYSILTTPRRKQSRTDPLPELPLPELSERDNEALRGAVLLEEMISALSSGGPWLGNYIFAESLGGRDYKLTLTFHTFTDFFDPIVNPYHADLLKITPECPLYVHILPFVSTPLIDAIEALGEEHAAKGVDYRLIAFVAKDIRYITDDRIGRLKEVLTKARERGVIVAPTRLPMHEIDHANRQILTST